MANNRNSSRVLSSPRPAPTPSPAIFGLFAIFTAQLSIPTLQSVSLGNYFLGLLFASILRFDKVNYLATCCFNCRASAFSDSQPFNRNCLGHITRQHDLRTLHAAVNDVRGAQRFEVYQVASHCAQLAGANLASYQTDT